jgi:4-alpha-glucanotransferase
LKRIPKNLPSLEDRRSGLLLHISSLPGPYYCGDLGKAAYQFADFLAAGGQSWWQMLPVSPIGLGNSPYSTTCSFAGEPLYIDLESLAEGGLLNKSEIERPRDVFPNRIDYRKARRYRESRLKTAFARFSTVKGNLDSPQFDQFLSTHKYWLEDFALFGVLAKKFRTRNWRNWPTNIRKRKPAALAKVRTEFSEELDFIKFLQFKFFTQWSQLKCHLETRHIGLIGDIPFFVGYQSSDVWAKQEYFRLNRDGSLKDVAGVPPDYYCSEGQLWGNPLYNWTALQKDGFSWWIERIRHMTTLFDVLRLDHFIGFYRYWEIKAESNSARNGRFGKTPGRELFQAIKSVLGDLPFIAEDLGTVVPEVYALRDEFGLPGMRVIQFGFGNEKSAKFHLPFSYTPNSVVYTGTHDNNTVVGWYDEAKKDSKKNKRTYNFNFYLDYIGAERANVHWEMIREAMNSVANLSIFPVQDILGLDENARMNVPGTATGNWQWRVAENSLTERLAKRLSKETQTFYRLPEPAGT